MLASRQKTIYRIACALIRVHKHNGWAAPSVTLAAQPLLSLQRAVMAARHMPADLDDEIRDIMSTIDDSDMITEVIPPAKQTPFLHALNGWPGDMFRDSDSRLLTVTEYAAKVGRSPATIRQRILRGVLPAQKTGSVWLIDADTPLDDNRITTGAYKDWRKPHKED